ncbi:MAG TPA: ATP-binding protein [Magnetospirillaceae bacterium]|jgi:signal transduction histidine kinase
MTRLRATIAFRFAFGYWILVVTSMAVIAGAVYFGTIGLLRQSTDTGLSATSKRLTTVFEGGGLESLTGEIQRLLSDNIDQDTEDYLVLDVHGQKLAGNITSWPKVEFAVDQFVDLTVRRYNRQSYSRLLPHQLPNGDTLVIGRDMEDQRQIKDLILGTLGLGSLFSAIVAAAGALIFRRKLENSVAVIRHTASKIEAGDLSRRIPIFGPEDEFVRLNHDINRMLDRIESLVSGVKDVSNAIAHDLRTPLGRIRVQLDEALRPGVGGAQLIEAARSAIDNVDGLIATLNRLLQIAEAESGASRRFFEAIDLAAVAKDVIELYDAMAEAKSISLIERTTKNAFVLGDRNLLATAIANLLDNSLKYAGSGTTVEVTTSIERDVVVVIVRDDGPGIPEAELEKVLERFYRLDQSRSQPGNGLGLSIVSAIANVHWGKLVLEDGHPGLIARVMLPVAEEARIAAS